MGSLVHLDLRIEHIDGWKKSIWKIHHKKFQNLFIEIKDKEFPLDLCFSQEFCII